MNTYSKLKQGEYALRLRCQTSQCKKVLGLVDKDGKLHTESTRSWIKTIIEKGDVVCKKCGNILHWNSKAIKGV